MQSISAALSAGLINPSSTIDCRLLVISDTNFPWFVVPVIAACTCSTTRSAREQPCASSVLGTPESQSPIATVGLRSVSAQLSSSSGTPSSSASGGAQLILIVIVAALELHWPSPTMKVNPSGPQ